MNGKLQEEAVEWLAKSISQLVLAKACLQEGKRSWQTFEKAATHALEAKERASAALITYRQFLQGVAQNRT